MSKVYVIVEGGDFGQSIEWSRFARHNYGNSTMISVIASSTINYALPNCDILTTTTPTGTYRNFSGLCGKAFRIPDTERKHVFICFTEFVV